MRVVLVLARIESVMNGKENGSICGDGRTYKCVCVTRTSTHARLAAPSLVFQISELFYALFEHYKVCLLCGAFPFINVNVAEQSPVRVPLLISVRLTLPAS
jgi:hypothetical protein